MLTICLVYETGLQDSINLNWSTNEALNRLEGYDMNKID
jgi:hypothetical protein